MWACNSHVEKCISSAKQLSGTWQHHRNPSSAHLGCSWLFINTMQTVQCGCMWNRKKNKGPEQVNTSFIISFVWCVYCVLFLVNRSCLTVLQKGKKPFLELYLFCFVSVEKVSICHSLFIATCLYKMVFFWRLLLLLIWQVQVIMKFDRQLYLLRARWTVKGLEF